MELLPCQHCRAMPTRDDIQLAAKARVICPKCGHQGPAVYYRTKPGGRVQAAAAWNQEMSAPYRE